MSFAFLLPIVALFVLVMLGLGLGLGAGVIAAIHHRRWGVLIGLGVVTLLPVLLILMIFVPYQRIQSDFGGSPQFESLVSPSSAAVEQRVERLLVEAAAEANSPSPAMAEPSIQLDTEASADGATAAVGEASQVETNADLPDWIDAPVKLHDKVFVSGPFVTQSQCEEDTRLQILSWLAEKAGVAVPEVVMPACDAIVEDVIRRTHLSKRETSVGTVYLQYTRAHSDSEVVNKIRQEVESFVTIAQRQRGRNQLLIGGGILLGAVGLLHGVLRSGGRQPEAT